MVDVVYYVAMSVDGMIADTEGGVGWLQPFQGSGDDYGYDAFCRKVGAVVMGARTYEWILHAGIDWPYYGVEAVVMTSRSLLQPAGATSSFWPATHALSWIPRRQSMRETSGSSVGPSLPHLLPNAICWMNTTSRSFQSCLGQAYRCLSDAAAAQVCSRCCWLSIGSFQMASFVPTTGCSGLSDIRGIKVTFCAITAQLTAKVNARLSEIAVIHEIARQTAIGTTGCRVFWDAVVVRKHPHAHALLVWDARRMAPPPSR